MASYHGQFSKSKVRLLNRRLPVTGDSLNLYHDLPHVR